MKFSPRRELLLLAIALCLAWPPTVVVACPFCTVLEPTLASRSEQAALVALCETVSLDNQTATVRVRQVLKGQDLATGRDRLQVSAPAKLQPGDLVLLFSAAGSDDPTSLGALTAVRVDEMSFGYFAASPSLRRPAAERLRYFARYLEHANPLVAEDAYLEFGHASFGDVRRAAEVLSQERLRAWLTDQRVLPARKGFYGLALGLAGQADDKAQNTALLQRLISEPADDFRAGFDGLLGGWLLLRGEPGLTLIEERILANPQARDGDLRHALVALRFYSEYGEGISRARLAAALHPLLERPEFAERAIIDLARWQDWTLIERIAGLYDRPAYAAAGTRRAIVGYLLACPEESAAAQLRRLRAADPTGIAGAEQELSILAPARQ